MKSLFTCGDGIGNVVQATPGLRALLDWGHKFDVFLYGAVPESASILRGLEGLHLISSDPNLFSGRKYRRGFKGFLSQHPPGVQIEQLYEAAHPFRIGSSEAQSTFNMARLIGYHGAMPPTYCWTDEPPIKMEGKLRIALHGGGKPTPFWLLKRYPHAKYSAVVQSVIERCEDVHVYVVGTKRDDMIHLDSSRVHDCRGVGTLTEQAGIIQNCDLFVGNDGGLAHVAAAVGTHAFIIYGPTQILKNLPPNNSTAISLDLACQPCQVKTKVPCNHECMSKLKPAVITETILGWLRDRTC